MVTPEVDLQGDYIKRHVMPKNEGYSIIRVVTKFPRLNSMTFPLGAYPTLPMG